MKICVAATVHLHLKILLKLVSDSEASEEP